MRLDYKPLVDVRRIKSKTEKQLIKSSAEVAKYTVKGTDIIVKDKNGIVDDKMTASAIYVLDLALENRRLVAFGGKLKEIHKKLNLDDAVDGDLVNKSEEKEEEDFDLEVYKWRIGYNQYISKEGQILEDFKKVKKGDKENGKTV